MSQTTQGLGLTEWSAATDYYNHVQLAQNWTLVDSQVLKKTWSVPNYDEATLVKFFGTANTPILMASASGSAYPFYTIYGAGSVVWGPGNLTPDTNLYRSGSALLKTDSSFTVGGSWLYTKGISTLGDINVNGSAFVSTNLLVGNNINATNNIIAGNQISAAIGTVTTLNVATLNAGQVIGASTATSIQGQVLTIQGVPGSASIQNSLSVGSLTSNAGITANGAISATSGTITSLGNFGVSGNITATNITAGNNVTASGFYGSIMSLTNPNVYLNVTDSNAGHGLLLQNNGLTTISMVPVSGSVVTGPLNATSFNNNSGGITNAGAVSGVTTLNMSSSATVGGVLNSIGHNNNSGGITNAGAVSGVTTLNMSSNATVGGVLNVSGSAVLGANSVFTAPVENISIVTGQIGSGATITLNLSSSGYYLYNNASGPAGSYTINITGASTILGVGQSITVAFLVLNGSTGYLPAGLQIDGTAGPFSTSGTTTNNITTYWSNNVAPVSANISTLDVYTFTIIKTAATPAYTILAQQSKF